MSENYLIVGLGASAGGLGALEEFLEHVPKDPGVAFVVVTHLAHGTVSLLPELLGSHCHLEVVQVTEPVRVQSNRVYIPPPGVAVRILDGELQLVEPQPGVPKPLAIDFFFRSLAQDCRDRAVGVVFSGTGSDGTNGLREIKAVCGLTVAQEVSTAQFPGMPQSAISALELDYVLAPAEMGKRIVEYAQRLGRSFTTRPEHEPGLTDTLERIFRLLRERTGHDFSQYKHTTIERRIARRMHVHQLEDGRDYLRYLQTSVQEVDLLFNELLIGVTSFFRDPPAFEVLAEEALPPVLRTKSGSDFVRGWVTGCSTGEEAYSVAIVLRELLEAHDKRPTLQLFGTDLDPRAVDFARAGLYPASIAADVSPSRLERCFVPEDGAYRVKKDFREHLVFAVHDLTGDPPFTRLDLIVCRNLLIYLNAELQKRLIPLFHYALRPGGILFLGSSETIGTFSHLFEPIGKKWKIFRRREVPTGAYAADLRLSIGDSVSREPSGPAVTRKIDHDISPAAERAIMQHLAPPAVLIQETGEIVHIHGRTGLFLEPATGNQGNANIYGMAREGLQLELTLAVRRAAAGEDVLRRDVPVRTNGEYANVDLRVKRLARPEAVRGLYLVSFELSPTGERDAAEPGGSQPGSSERVLELEGELIQAKARQQTAVEELETANEELKSANEELQSMNEELQSSNEELETSKEEMQSMNEELQTVNAELQTKVEELSRANDDMANLLNATEIATVFLDNQLNIVRYTEKAKRVIRLIASDVGRSIGDLVSNLRYPGLVEDAREVLRSLAFKEVEVQGEDGAWYFVRILPYRTMENVIDGLVVTFVNITKVRGLQQQTDRLLGALTTLPTSLFAQTADLKYEWTLGSLFGRWPSEVTGKSDHDLLTVVDAGTLTGLKRRVLEDGRRLHQRLELSQIDGTRGVYDLYLQPAPSDGIPDVRGLIGIITQLSDGAVTQ